MGAGLWRFLQSAISYERVGACERSAVKSDKCFSVLHRLWVTVSMTMNTAEILRKGKLSVQRTVSVSEALAFSMTSSSLGIPEAPAYLCKRKRSSAIHPVSHPQRESFFFFFLSVPWPQKMNPPGWETRRAPLEGQWCPELRKIVNMGDFCSWRGASCTV